MAGDKPFEPTASRLARAKREGDVPRSRDVATTAAFAFGGLAAGGVAGAAGAAAAAALREAARGAFPGRAYAVLAACAAAVLVAALVGGVGAPVVQAGGVSFVLPAPNLTKLAPLPGLKRMFGRDAAVALAKALVAAVAVAAAVLPPARDAFAASAAGGGIFALASIVSGALGSAFGGAVCVAAAFAVVDIVVERQKWRRRLRMSFDELKRDHKQTEGDPQLRGRRRQAHRELVRGSLARVKDAAFVIANPEHVAIALEYAPPAVAVPRVLVRALDDAARAVKERARALGIPVVENVELARALFAETEVGDPIPRERYGAVAFIVALLLREGKVKR